MADNVPPEKIKSWARKYFEIKEVTIKDKKTGVEKVVLSDVCILPSECKRDAACGATYKHNLRDGTKSIQRHLATVHRSNPEIEDAIKKQEQDRSKKVAYLTILKTINRKDFII